MTVIIWHYHCKKNFKTNNNNNSNNNTNLSVENPAGTLRKGMALSF